jgi:glycosyltransferase involved in cell wall biosynthesis
MLDEAAALPGLLAELASAGLLGRAVFVDNGSSDGSDRLVEQAGGSVTREPRRGYGYACLAGADVCRQRGAGVVVFMEADGTDDPRDLWRLVDPVLAGHVALMVGSRRGAVRHKGGMPAHQRWGNALAVVCLRALFGVRLPDNGPFRAIRSDLLAELAMEPSAYAWTTEVIKAARVGARVECVETAYRERRGESKIAGSFRGTWGAFAGIFGTMLRLKLHPDGRGRGC